MVRKFDSNWYHLSGPSAQVVIVPSADVVHGDKRLLQSAGGSIDWVRWGATDDEPNKIVALNWESPSKPALMDQAASFILGNGVAPFRKRFEKGKVIYERDYFPDLDDWFEEQEIREKYLELAAMSFTFCEMAFVNWSVDASKDISIQTIQPLKCRYNKGKNGMLVSPLFGTESTPQKKDITQVSLFDRKDPHKFAESIWVLKKPQIGQEFYNLGLFWGTKLWTKVANMIPRFHEAGLNNGYNIKYLIEIDESYFIAEGENPEDEAVGKEIEKRKDAFLNSIDDFLAGIENTDKAVVMIGDLTDKQGKSRDLIRVKPLTNTMSDDAYTKLYNAANIAQAQGHTILPVLAGISEGAKLGGSGSELSNAAMYQVAYRAPWYRWHLLKPLNLAARLITGQRDIEYRFVDVEFTTLDKNPTGKQNVIGA